jgi:hypothetical protein
MVEYETDKLKKYSKSIQKNGLWWHIIWSSFLIIILEYNEKYSSKIPNSFR